MKKFIVTVKLGDDCYDTVMIEQFDAYNAINDAITSLNCSSEDIISVIRIGE